MTEAGERDDDDRDPLDEIFGPDEQDDAGPPAVDGWLGALSQMSGAAFIVFAIVVAFVVAAIVFRWLWP